MKPFAVYLGGKAKGASIEVHDIAFVIAEDVKSAFPQLKESWFGEKSSVHVDAWADLSEVDGHRISLSRKPAKGPKLFFINIGFYQKEIFAEQHRFHFLVAESKEEAKAKARKLYEKGTQLSHLDNVVEIDEIRELEKLGGYYLQLKAGDFRKQPVFENVYWPIKE